MRSLHIYKAIQPAIKWLEDHGMDDLIRQQFVVVKMALDEDTSFAPTCVERDLIQMNHELINVAIELSLQRAREVRAKMDQNEGEDKCANWQPIGTEDDTVPCS